MKRKKRIILCTLIPGRDYGVAYILAKLLERCNCECLIAHDGNYVSRLFKAWKPDAVYFVTLSKYKIIKESYPNAKLFYCASEGGCWGESSDEIKIFKDSEYYSAISKVYMWSETIKDDLKNILNEKTSFDFSKHEKLLKKFITVGNPKLDLVVGRSPVKNCGKVRVGFVGNFYGLNSKDGVNVLGKIIGIYSTNGSYTQDGYFSSREEDIGETVSQINLLISYLEIMDELGTDDYEFSIRPYPLEDFSQYKKTRSVKDGHFVVDESIDYGTWLAGQDVLIGVVSTTILPIALMEKTYINMDALCGRSSYDVFFFKNIIDSLKKFSPKTVDEAVGMIRNKEDYKILSSDISVVLKGFSSQKLKGSALYRIANDIVSELDFLSDSDFILRVPTWIVNLLSKLRYRDPGNNYSYFDSGLFYKKAKIEFDPIVKEILKEKHD